MEKDKSRGLKHSKDKKYKGKSVKNPKYVPSKSKPNLGSNWDRYHSDEESEHEHRLSTSTDFSLLSNAPITTGSHFQFKNEKVKDENASEEVSLFCLDLDFLHRSMLTIPFYQKLGIEKKYFKDLEINTMDKEAEIHLFTYNEYIQSTTLHDPIQDTIIPESTDIDERLEKLSDELNNISLGQEVDILELIENCSIHDDRNTDVTDSKLNIGEKQDLEQWLEDILED